jgi:hypothetical protein
MEFSSPDAGICVGEEEIQELKEDRRKKDVEND